MQVNLEANPELEKLKQIIGDYNYPTKSKGRKATSEEYMVATEAFELGVGEMKEFSVSEKFVTRTAFVNLHRFCLRTGLSKKFRSAKVTGTSQLKIIRIE